MKLKKTFAVKETINKTKQNKKRHSTEWEKIFAKGRSNKGLICKIYKEYLYIHIHIYKCVLCIYK